MDTNNQPDPSSPQANPAPESNDNMPSLASEATPISVTISPTNPAPAALVAPETPVAPTPAPQTPQPATLATPSTTPGTTPISAFGVAPQTPFVGGLSAEEAAKPAKPLSTSSKKGLKVLLMALMVVVLLGGGSAAAYFGVILPNKPENVLLASVANSLQAPQSSFDGTLDASETGGYSTKVTFKGDVDAPAKAFSTQISVTFSGVTVPLELRYVGGNAYVKVDDLSQVVTLAAAADPSMAAYAKTLSDQVSGKWIVFDSTLIKQAKLDCSLNVAWTLSDSDLKLLYDGYLKDPFATIKNTSSDTVKGKKVTKFELSLDDDKMAAYGDSLQSLSAVKAMQACQGSSATKSTTKSVGDHDKTPITVWINKGSKQIVQIASTSTAKDAKNGITGKVTIGLSYGKVNITAPKGAIPAMQLYAQLMQSSQASGVDPTSLLVGSALSSGGSDTTSSNPADAERQADIQSLQTQLEAYYAQNGYYPSLTDMNNASWRQKNMPSLDAAALKDPKGTSSTLVVKPAANIYSYAPTTDNESSCEASDKDCTLYTLTATLSDGSAYTKYELD